MFFTIFKWTYYIAALTALTVYSLHFLGEIEKDTANKIISTYLVMAFIMPASLLCSFSLRKKFKTKVPLKECIRSQFKEFGQSLFKETSEWSIVSEFNSKTANLYSKTLKFYEELDSLNKPINEVKAKQMTARMRELYIRWLKLNSECEVISKFFRIKSDHGIWRYLEEIKKLRQMSEVSIFEEALGKSMFSRFKKQSDDLYSKTLELNEEVNSLAGPIHRTLDQALRARKRLIYQRWQKLDSECQVLRKYFEIKSDHEVRQYLDKIRMHWMEIDISKINIANKGTDMEIGDMIGKIFNPNR